jgi:ABC-type branched-subunit amino acid transport system substrate-binding protein
MTGRRVAIGLAVTLLAGAAVTAAAPAGDVAAAKIDLAVIRGGAAFELQNTQLERGIVIGARVLGRTKNAPARFAVRATAVERGGENALLARLKAQGTDVVVLPCNVDREATLAAAAARAAVLALSPCTPGPVPDGAFAVAMTGNAQAGQLATYATQQYVKAAFVVDTNGSERVSTLTRYLRAAAARAGIEIVGSARLEATGTNAAEVARAIARARPTPYAVFTAVSPTLADALARALAKRKVRAPIYGTDGTDATGRFPAWQEKNIYTSYGFARETARPFEAAYRAAYGIGPTGSLPGLGLETVHVLQEAARAARSTSAEALAAAFESGFSVTGIGLGDLVYPGRGVREPVASVGIVRILRGKAEPLFAGIPPWVPAR